MYLSCSLCECCESQSAAFADVPLLSIHLNSVVAAWHFDPSPWTVGSMERTVEFPAACRSPFSSFQLSNKECEAGKICWAMYGQANFFFFFFMEAKQLPWNWQVMYQWVGNWVWSLDHFPTTFRDFFVIVSIVSNVADSGMRQQCLELFFSCCFQDLVYLLSFTTFSHLFNPHRQAQLLLLLGGAGANLEFSSKHLVLKCFLSTCPILQKTKHCAFWQDEELLERSTHSNSRRSQYGTALFIITCFNSVRISTLKQASPYSPSLCQLLLGYESVIPLVDKLLRHFLAVGECCCHSWLTAGALLLGLLRKARQHPGLLCQYGHVHSLFLTRLSFCF